MAGHRTKPRIGAARVILLLLAGLLAGAIALQAVSSLSAATPIRSMIQESSVESSTEASEPAISGEQDSTPQNSAPKTSRPVGVLPKWTENKRSFQEGTGIESIVISSDERLRQREAEQELEERMVVAVNKKLHDMFGSNAEKAVQFDLPYIRDNLIHHWPDCDVRGYYHHVFKWPVPQENRDKVTADELDAFRCFVELRFNSTFEANAREQWQDGLVGSRTRQIGLMAIGTMLVLGLLFGYLTAEHKTRGFYSRRLQTVGVGMLLAGGALIWWLSTQFTWL